MEMVRLKVDLLRKGEYCGNGELGAESAYQVDTCGQRHGVRSFWYQILWIPLEERTLRHNY